MVQDIALLLSSLAKWLHHQASPVMMNQMDGAQKYWDVLGEI